MEEQQTCGKGLAGNSVLPARLGELIAARLHAVADQMAGYRDLPMGSHDEKAMSDRAVLEAFEKFVESKQQLLALLQATAQQDQTMLAVMRGSDAGGS